MHVHVNMHAYVLNHIHCRLIDLRIQGSAQICGIPCYEQLLVLEETASCTVVVVHVQRHELLENTVYMCVRFRCPLGQVNKNILYEKVGEI